ncbi:MAG: thymidine phosphorylase, partial [Actinomycetota bacterium]|nr:thymidine phosphorylase [Actinomycetota bacterium]
PVQPGAGVRCLVRPGDDVCAGQPLLELHTDTPDAVPAALAALRGTLRIGHVVAAEPLVLDVLR